MAACVLSFDEARADGFPIYSLNRQKKLEQLWQLLRYDRAGLIADGVVGQSMHGLALAWHYQPHAWSVRCGNMLTPSEVFRDDDLLRNALAQRMRLGSCKTKSDLRKALRTFTGTQGVSNFRPTAAAAIYDRYLPEEGGTVWDMSAGFGGRLLGALASRKVTKYIGTDPAAKTMDGLCEMRDELSPLMRGLGYEPPVMDDLRCVGSEDFHPAPESTSLCFTSPHTGPMNGTAMSRLRATSDFAQTKSGSMDI